MTWFSGGLRVLLKGLVRVAVRVDCARFKHTASSAFLRAAQCSSSPTIPTHW